MKTITAEEARRILLERQFLVDPAPDPIAVLQRCIVLQSQYATTPAQAIAARMQREYSFEDFEHLVQSAQVLRGWTLRLTLQTYAASNEPIARGAASELLRKRHDQWFEKKAEGGIERMRARETKVIAALHEGPLSRKELHDRVQEFSELSSTGWGTDVMGLSLDGRVFHVGGQKPVFALRESLNVSGPPSSASLKELARAYFQQLGPASVSDFCYWTGLTQRACMATELLKEGELVSVRIEGVQGMHYMAPEVADGPIPELPQGVRWLPKFDPLVLSYRHKDRVMPAQFVKQVMRPAGQVEALLLIDGEIIGTWRQSGKVRNVYLWRNLKASEAKKVERTTEVRWHAPED